MNKASRFIFKSYAFDNTKKTATFVYRIDDKEFQERYIFDFDFVEYDAKTLDRALQNLFFIAGISYYKAFLPTEIIIEQGNIDQHTADFLNNLYQKGLGEFFYVNNLDPNYKFSFPINSTIETLNSTGGGTLVALGGGKDSLVSIEILQKAERPITTWSLGHKQQLLPLVESIGLPHIWVNRQIDPYLTTGQAPYNGHVPISAIFAGVGTIVAILNGKQDVVMSNEASADEPTLNYRGVEINHQYSKSSDFEISYQQLLAHCFGTSPRYFSLLRPFSEVQIAKLFAPSFDKYKSVFSSCNKAFRQNETSLFWCGKCPKCAFIFLALTPFVDKTALQNIFESKNLLLDPTLKDAYRQLLGLVDRKPLECVGTIKECRWAMDQAKTIYPELNELFVYPRVENFDPQALYRHSLPEDIVPLLPYS